MSRIEALSSTEPQTTGPNVVCSARGITKSFGGRPVLVDAGLTVQAGELVAVRGPSGSGKSTLLNIIGMLDLADAGSIGLFGEPAPRPGSRGAMMLRRHRIGYLFQNFALIDADSVDANLSLAQRYVDGSESTRSQDREAALERVGLAGMGKSRVFELSGGEQQRLAVARLFVRPCDLVLADEPTGSLDAANRDAVLTMLRGLTDAGCACVVVTHDDMVSEASDRTITLQSLKSPATAAEVRSQS